MAHLISFTTAKFDVSKETPNPINPIAGESVLMWLRERIAGHYEATVPDAEDWGWYIDVEGGGASYLVGASAEADSSTQDLDWTIQVHKKRSLKDKISGKNKMASDDPLFALVETIIRGDASINDVEIDKDA